MKEKIIVVTGGAGGLGSATCRLLAREGAHVVIADNRQAAADALKDELNARGDCASSVALDLTDAAQIEARIGEIAATHGRIDALINNAGIDLTAPAEKIPIGAWDRILAVNLRAPFILSRAVLPMMKARGRGEIINIVSTAALRAWPNASAYHASKWGLLGLSHALHTEAREHRVRVTALIAGGMRTPFLTERFPDIDLSRLQDPASVAETILHILNTPEGTVIAEVTVLPLGESSWP